jgi:nitroreductase
MELLEALRTTRAMRRMKPDPLPDEIIARIVDAGVRAPSPGQKQSWRFVVVTDRRVMGELAVLWRATRDALLEEIPTLYASATQAASSQYLHDHFAEVPVVVFGYAPAGQSPAIVAPALWSMCLAARGEGVGSVFTTLLLRATPAVDEILGVPADVGVELIGVVPMGFPLGRWDVAARQPAHEVSFADRWGVAPDWRAETPTVGSPAGLGV